MLQWCHWTSKTHGSILFGDHGLGLSNKCLMEPDISLIKPFGRVRSERSMWTIRNCCTNYPFGLLTSWWRSLLRILGSLAACRQQVLKVSVGKSIADMPPIVTEGWCASCHEKFVAGFFINQCSNGRPEWTILHANCTNNSNRKCKRYTSY